MKSKYFKGFEYCPHCGALTQYCRCEKERVFEPAEVPAELINQEEINSLCQKESIK